MSGRLHSSVLAGLSALLIVAWCLVFLFAINRLGFGLRDITILTASLVAIVAEEFLAARRRSPRIKLGESFDRKLLRAAFWRMSGIVVILVAFEAVRGGERFVKPFLLVFFGALLLAQIVTMRHSTRKLFAALVCWTGAVTLYLGMGDVVPYGRPIGSVLVVIAIFLYFLVPEKNDSAVNRANMRPDSPK